MTGNIFGNHIRRARQAAKLSLRELGERVRKPDGTAYSPQYLNDVEHGRRNPPDEDTIRQLATALSIDPEVLLAEAGREPETVKEYLTAMPNEREVIGRLFRKAKEKGFTDWSRLERAMDEVKKK
jgi:transcriptional regulator with XRE-family HTH domain